MAEVDDRFLLLLAGSLSEVLQQHLFIGRLNADFDGAQAGSMQKPQLFFVQLVRSGLDAETNLQAFGQYQIRDLHRSFAMKREHGIAERNSANAVLVYQILNLLQNILRMTHPVL